MKRLFFFTIAVMVFAINAGPLQAQSPLSSSDVEHFMAAMGPLQNLRKKYNITPPKSPAMPGASDFSPMSHALTYIKGHEAFSEFQSIIKGAGFSSPEVWASVGDRIMRAYITLKIEDRMTPEQRQKMQDSIVRIQKNDYLTPEAKQQIIDRLQHMMTVSDHISAATKVDQESLKPHLGALEQLFKRQGNFKEQP